MKKITILGAGLVGSLLSIFLAKRGYRVSVYEKRSDMRKMDLKGGRSINLALSNRGFNALEAVGLKKLIEENIIPMRGRMIHDIAGNINFQQYGKENQAINSVSRSRLNELLMDAAEDAGAQIYFNHKCLEVNIENTIAQFEDDNNLKSSISSDILIGSDGAFSALRSSFEKIERFNYSQSYLDHGYKELTIPPAANGDFAMDPNALHIWPRGQFMLIALPNLDRSFTCTLFFPFEGNLSFQELTSKEKVLDFFEKTFPDAVPLMPTLTEDFFMNPTSSLVTIKCSPWVNNKCMLIGDAAHAIVPFYGQGMNAGFEDCLVLNDLLDQLNDDWNYVLPEYQKSRKPNGDAIADLAIQNFIEMRDLVADPKFLLRKKIEAKLYDLFPDKWVPLYSMVTFSNIPYSTAKSIGMKQTIFMEKILQEEGIDLKWENMNYNSLINEFEEFRKQG
jgi:kynurenine 3-monooxygenase